MNEKTPLLERLLSPSGDPQQVGGAALAHLASTSQLGPCLQSRSISLEQAEQLFGDPLLQALLERTVVANSALERLLTGLRRRLLETAYPPGTVVHSLAQQCANNEYVWAVSQEEEELLKESPRSDLQACYGPPHLPTPEVESNGFSRATSSAVAAQYEKSPYPRYLGYTRWTSRSIQAHLEHLFPRLADRFLPAHRDTARVLIAGCGTGRQALSAATRYQAEVVGIDLSQTSLSYAEGFRLRDSLNNLTFQQSDLLDLGESTGLYDLIECTGVLHHLADPQEGLRALLARLRPGGALRLGLYSRVARRSVAAARQVLAEVGLTADQLIEARQTLLRLAPKHPAAGVTRYLDFYTRSGTQDLLWPAQEMNFDLPEVSRLLEQERLTFLGFEEPAPGVFEAYVRLFPNDPAHQRLDYWNVFERQFPNTFRAMYQFWCLKPTNAFQKSL